MGGPDAARDRDVTAASGEASDKSRPIFNVGDDEASDGRLTSAAESTSTVRRDVGKMDVEASRGVTESSDAADTVKLSTPKCPQLDAVANVTTPLMHKSASKYGCHSCDFSKLIIQLCLLYTICTVLMMPSHERIHYILNEWFSGFESFPR